MKALLSVETPHIHTHTALFSLVFCSWLHSCWLDLTDLWPLTTISSLARTQTNRMKRSLVSSGHWLEGPLCPICIPDSVKFPVSDMPLIPPLNAGLQFGVERVWVFLSSRLRFLWKQTDGENKFNHFPEMNTSSSTVPLCLLLQISRATLHTMFLFVPGWPQSDFESSCFLIDLSVSAHTIVWSLSPSVFLFLWTNFVPVTVLSFWSVKAKEIRLQHIFLYPLFALLLFHPSCFTSFVW